MGDEITYKDSIKEIETITEQIERDEIDVDTLSEKVKRAADLIKICKSKLTKTENEVKDILSEMDSENTGDKEADEGHDNAMQPF